METPIQKLSQTILDVCERMESQAGYTTDLEARDNLRQFAKQTRAELTAVLVALPQNQPRRIEKVTRVLRADVPQGAEGCDCSEDCTAVLFCDDQHGIRVGYYEERADGSFACQIANADEWSLDESVIRAWLLANI